MKTYIVDSFTDKPFEGNPAGVCILESDLSDDKMLKIAQELGLSETAFIKETEHKNRFSIRFFSPKMEIPLCGHATLAAAKVVLEGGGKNLSFRSVQNVDLDIRAVGDLIEMQFPRYSVASAEASEPLLSALGINQVTSIHYNEETKILMIEIDNPEILSRLAPDFSALYKSHNAINGVLVTSPGNKGYDFYSRYFWPWSGTNEDPVTGGTHMFMAPFWAQKLNNSTLKSFQCSQRTGFMDVEVRQNDILIKGNAAIVLEGQIRSH